MFREKRNDTGFKKKTFIHVILACLIKILADGTNTKQYVNHIVCIQLNWRLF